MQELFNFFQEMKSDPEANWDMISRAESICEKRAMRIKRNEDEIRKYVEKRKEREMKDDKVKGEVNSMLILLFLMLMLSDDDDKDDINFADIFALRNFMRPKF